MGANYSHTTRSDGLTLTAAIYNADHQNHIDNMVPGTIDDHSSNLAAMKVTTDPYDSSTASLATDLGGELARLRYMIKQITGQAEWYVDASANLLSIGESRTRNHLINGGFNLWQRNTSFTGGTDNSDDSYTADRWILLSDGNDIVDVTQETSIVPTSASSAMKLDVETADKKFGIVQVLENKDSIPLDDQAVTFSFKARKTGATISHLRAAIISWDSTADTVTSDVVSAWEAAGTDPTLAANWTYENTPANLDVLTTSYQSFSVTGTVDTLSTANVAVFIWTDDITMNVADVLYIADCKLEKGSTATGFTTAGANFSEELAMCQRYYEKSYALAVVPGTASTFNSACTHRSTGSETEFYGSNIEFRVRKKSDPTMSIYSPDTGTAQRVYDVGSTSDETVSNVANEGETSGGRVQLSAAAADGERKVFHWTADAEL